MTDLAGWIARLEASPRPIPTLSLVAPLQRSDGGSGAFLGLASDGNRYWVKPAHNPQGIKTLGAEVVVAAVGQAMGAPVRPVALMSIPTDLQSWRYRDHFNLANHTAHASLDLGKAFVSMDWDHTSSDHNSTRQAKLYALWDLCLGGDAQWLHDLDDDLAIWSFDHGFWFGGDGDWDAATIQPIVNRIWQYELDLDEMSSAALLQAASAVRNLTDADILTAISAVPVDWGIPAKDLAALGWLIAERREAVALRAEELADRVVYP